MISVVPRPAPMLAFGEDPWMQSEAPRRTPPKRDASPLRGRNGVEEEGGASRRPCGGDTLWYDFQTKGREIAWRGRRSSGDLSGEPEAGNRRWDG